MINHTKRFLTELNFFQNRAFKCNAIKAGAHRRFVIGFRETKNFLSIKAARLLIIATDCEEDNVAIKGILPKFYYLHFIEV